jgi:pimeloyl-ACP methyl ester carboxylesterase
MRIACVLAIAAACGGTTVQQETSKLGRGSHRVAVDGVDVSIEVRGSGPVCIVHPGGPGLTAEYLHLPALENKFTAVYVDPIGTGASGKLPAGELYSRARDVRVLEGVRVALGVERACFVGHSYGGLVVQDYAVKHPGHVAALLLYSTSPTTEPEWEQQRDANLEWFRDQAWYPPARAAYDKRGSATTQAELDAIWRSAWPLYFGDYAGSKSLYDQFSARLAIAFDVFTRRDQGKQARFDVRRTINRIGTTPTVIVAGERDFIHGVVPAKWLASVIAGSKVIVIPRAGHFAHIEQPGQFSDAVDVFAGQFSPR